MSDSIDFHKNVGRNAHRVCQVAYTLNNDQPVICTIVGDQPLFYMDYECDHEDEFLEEAELKALEAEIHSLQREIDTFERFHNNFHTSSEQIFDDFLENELSVCGDEKFENKCSIENLKETLSQSRVAQSYIELADKHGVEIVLSSHVENGEYNREAGTILISKSLGAADQTLVLARELRRHWQHRQGALIHPLMFHPDSAILVNRVQQADLAVSMVRIAWELQLADYKDAWERIENSSMSDLGRAFAREAFVDFRTINNGMASAAVFENWFLSERCRTEDRKIIQHMLADYQGYVFDQVESESAITPALIAALGAMPFGKNYLAQHVNTIMEDPIFTDVRDRSNANFLWFIKFEKSFRETEQELQNSKSNQKADDIAQAAFLKENRERYNGTEDQIHGSDAEVVQLYSEFEPREHGKRVENGKGAEIIYLR